MARIVELKKELTMQIIELRKVEMTLLPVERAVVREMNKEFFEKLKNYEDIKTAAKKESNEKGRD